MENLSACHIPLSKKLDVYLLIFAQEEQQQDVDRALDEGESVQF